MRLLLAIFLINVCLLVFGIFISWLDIRLFGAGLYLALVSTVTVVIVLAFCLVGTDEQTEPTVAKQMWSKSRQTIRRYTTVRRNESNDLMLYSKQVESGTTPHKPTAVRYVLPSDQTTSPTPSASTSDPASGSLVHEKQQKCVVQLHSSDQSSSANDSSTANCNNTVIYL